MYVKNKKDNLLVTSIIEGLEDKKALGITLIDLKELNSSIADYFVVCHANSTTHVGSIATNLIEFVRKKMKEKPFYKEGMQNSEWVLLDYSNVLVHIFLKDKRYFYDIESLWGDAKITSITEDVETEVSLFD